MREEFSQVKDDFFKDYIPVKEAIKKDSVIKRKVMESLDKIEKRGGRLIPVKEAMTGSDLLGNLIVTQHELDAEPPFASEDPKKDITQICAEKTALNFNEVRLYQTTEVEDLLEVKPTEDYKGTYFEDEYDSMSIIKYGRIFAVAWEALISDTIGEFKQLQGKLKRAAVRTMFRQIVDTFQANTNFFAAACNNIGTGVLNQANLEAGISAIMSQTDANENELNLGVVYLVVPTLLGFKAEQLVNPILQSIAAASMNVAPVRFNLKVIVAPWLTSATGWYLFADPNDYPAITRLTLAGHKGVELLIRKSDQMALAGVLTGEIGSFRGDVLDYKVRIFHNSTTRYCRAAYYSTGDNA